MSTGEDYWWIEDIFSIVEPRPTGFASTEEEEFDVIVVGSGMAGSTAAALVHDAGSSVVILEASDEVGGTTYKSGAGLWIPNNSLMRGLGIREDRDECLRYMVRIAHPDSFDADADRYGATAWEWEKLTTYYDNAADAIDALIAAGVLDLTFFGSFTERYPTMLSYHSELDMSIQGGYRHLMPRRANGRRGAGVELSRQLGAAIRERRIPLSIQHRVRGVLQGPDGAVVGVKVETPNGERTLLARQGVIFATGGFAHNLELLDRHWRGPLYSSCAVPTAQGDFVEIGLELGAELAHMRNGWLYEDLLEKAAPDRVCMEGGVNVPPGDSMIYVDVDGERQVNEKQIYQDRAEVFWRQDENGDYPNRVMLMVYDDFLARDPRPWLFLDAFRPPKPWMIEGATLAELAAKVDERLADLEHLVGPIRLAVDFPERLAATIKRFNRFALAGKDEDFHRGEALHEHDWHGPAREGNDKNPTMYPFADGGPYYCTLICGMVLDTNGGPKTNAASQVLRGDGSVIPGLYGAGNCVAAVAGDGYLSGGSTLGPAATFAYLAAQHIVTQPAKDLAAFSGSATG